jgi:hypothetical protein
MSRLDTGEQMYTTFIFVNSRAYLHTVSVIFVKEENTVKKCVIFAVSLSEHLKTINILYIQFNRGFTRRNVTSQHTPPYIFGSADLHISVVHLA